MPDITHIKGSDQSEPKATLDEVAAEMKHWRANKAEQGTKIPRQLCRKILYLTRRHPERAVRSLLGISKAQYDAMYNEFYALPEGDDGSVSVEFCEALPPSTTPPPLMRQQTKPPPHRGQSNRDWSQANV